MTATDTELHRRHFGASTKIFTGRVAVWMAIVVAVLTGCGGARVLVDPPTIFREAGYPVETVPAALRDAMPEVLFVTDRAPEDAGFGAERSLSVTFGKAKIGFGDGQSWDDLVATNGNKRKRLKPLAIQADGQFPQTPIPFDVVGGRPVDLPEGARAKRHAQSEFRSVVRDYIRKTGNREVLVLVHGFNTDFAEAVSATAEVWHFTGRRTIPISYSWPAGSGGLFGYFTDRESGEFTILHLKEFLRTLAATPEISCINLIAHSRGTDVATTALRELVIEARAAGKNPRKTLKIENLVLAAPDLDFGVVSQRLIGERFGPAFGRITVYTNNSDGALGLSQRLMSGTRFGRIGSDALTPEERQIFQKVRNVDFISVSRGEGLFGHTYFREDPDVLSDISLLLNTRAVPGSSDRPLIRQSGNFWLLPEGYPYHVDAN